MILKILGLWVKVSNRYFLPQREAKIFKMSLDPTSNWTAYSNVSFMDNDDTYPTKQKSSIRSKEEKYAEDILSLHEAYQVKFNFTLKVTRMIYFLTA